MIIVDTGRFKLGVTDTISVKTQWVPHGTLDIKSKDIVFEFFIYEFFDLARIDDLIKIKYNGLNKADKEKAMDYDRQIIGSFPNDCICSNPIINGVVYEHTFNIIWE